MTDLTMTDAADEIERLRGHLKMFKSNHRDNYDAFCAMRNTLNEMFGNMRSQESTLLNGPEMSHECAAVVECLIPVHNEIIQLREANECLRAALTSCINKSNMARDLERLATTAIEGKLI